MGKSALELEREARIAANKQRMLECGLLETVQAIATQQKPRKRALAVTEEVEVQIRRSSRAKVDVSYNEQAAFFKAAEAALDRPRRIKLKVVKRSGGGGLRGVSGWHPGKGIAGQAAQERCFEAAEECVAGLSNPAFVKSLSQSMVSSGFWCSTPKGLPEALGKPEKTAFAVFLPEGQAVPEASQHGNAEGGWDVVWLPHGKGSYGFSGGWRGFAIDLDLYPGDAVVCELLPEEAHRGAARHKFSMLFHVFRALQYETEGEKEARLATAAANAAGEEEEEEVSEQQQQQQQQQAAREEEEEEEEQQQQQGAPGSPRQARRKGTPAAVEEGIAELSGEDERPSSPAMAAAAALEAASRRAAQAPRAGKRQRQTQLEEAGAKRRRSRSAVLRDAAPSTAKASAAKKKAAGGSGRRKKRASPKPALSQPEEPAVKRPPEGDGYYVEMIANVRGTGANREYLIKWWGYPPEENTWEPASNLDDPIHTYKLAPGLVL